MSCFARVDAAGLPLPSKHRDNSGGGMARHDQAVAARSGHGREISVAAGSAGKTNERIHCPAGALLNSFANFSSSGAARSHRHYLGCAATDDGLQA
jgi:hypothetical protein